MFLNLTKKYLQNYLKAGSSRVVSKCSRNTLFFFFKYVVFQGQAEYSYFSADFRL